MIEKDYAYVNKGGKDAKIDAVAHQMDQTKAVLQQNIVNLTERGDNLENLLEKTADMKYCLGHENM